MSTSLSNPSPQFGTAEFQGGPDRCKACGQLLGARYYRIGSAQACEACAEKAKLSIPKDTHTIFMRALLLGAGGAILGLIAYSTFSIVSGIEIGYLSLLVGFLVAKAMMKGSGGIGGRRYQLAALAFTYAAVSLSAIPISIAHFAKEPKQPTRAQQSANSDPAVGSTAADSAGQSSSDSTGPKKQPLNLLSVIGTLFFLGLASPFLALQDPLNGVIGLVILSVGLRIAWQMTAGKTIDILGPFNRAGSSPG